MNPTDFGLDYTGGINAPDNSVVGRPAIADESGVNIAYRYETATIARDKTGTPMLDANGAQLYDVDPLAPRVTRFDTPDATPFLVALPAKPLHGVVTYICEVHAIQDDGAHFVDEFYRIDYRVSKVAPGSSGLIAAGPQAFPAAVDTIGITAIVFDGSNLAISGKAATLIHWTVKVRYEITQYGV